MNNKNGFSLLIVMGLSLILSSLSIALLGYKRSIDNLYRNTVFKSKLRSAEDIIKSKVYLLITESKSSHELVLKLKKISSEFKSDIDSTFCKSPCSMLLESPVFTPNESHPHEVIFKLKFTNDLKVKNVNLNLLAIKITDIPNFSTADTHLSKNENLFCNDITKPIFTGTSLLNGKLVPTCKALQVNAEENLRSIAGAQSLTVSCSEEKSQWLKGINKDLSPQCLSFPDGISNETNAKPCSDNEFTQSFEINSELKFVNVKCEKRRDPYGF